MLWRLRALCATMVIAGTMILPIPPSNTAQATSPLSIDWAACESSWGTDPWRYFFCEAGVSGGTGGYAYQWDGLSNAGFFAPADGSIANGTCSVNQWAQVQVTVWDSSGASASRQVSFRCPYNPF